MHCNIHLQIFGGFCGIKITLSADLDSASCMHLAPELCSQWHSCCSYSRGGFVVHSSAKLLEFHVCRASHPNLNRALWMEQCQANNPTWKLEVVSPFAWGSSFWGADFVIQQIFGEEQKRRGLADHFQLQPSLLLPGRGTGKQFDKINPARTQTVK